MGVFFHFDIFKSVILAQTYSSSKCHISTTIDQNAITRILVAHIHPMNISRSLKECFGEQINHCETILNPHGTPMIQMRKNQPKTDPMVKISKNESKTALSD